MTHRISQLRVAAISLLLVIYFCQPTGAQSNVSPKWMRFNLLGVDTTWKFKIGEAEPAFFTATFNDESWQTVSNTYLDQLRPDSPGWSGMGTFRKTIIIPDSLKGQQVELLLNMFGNSEIYLDGKRLCRFGDVSGKKGNQVIFQKTVPFALDTSSSHVLCIYYANTIKPTIAYRYWLIGYNIALSPVTAVDTGDYYFYHIIISLGIILSFALFFWCVYAFYRHRFASLISALWLTNFSLIFIGTLLRDYVSPDIKQFILGQELWEIGFSCTFGWIFIFIHTLYYKRVTWRIWVAGSLMLTSIVLIFLKSRWWFDVTRVFLLLYMVGTLAVLLVGLTKKRTGFWILLIGLLSSVAGTIFVIFDIFHIFPWYITGTQNILGVVTDLTFPLSVALHLAFEFGSANRDLRKQLSQVNELSVKTIEQEKEKQQILSGQNELLEKQVSSRTAELSNSLENLKSTQAQLIQSEKMASLGQLTAGIAHEIQNPLNFVNNFSEVNSELISELVNEADKGNIDEVKLIAGDIKDNSEKINHHGKRADSIVKGMLQHSRRSEAVKEPADINALCDEYLRLAYHGLRAKDKSFSAEFKTNFHPGIGKVTVISQDIVRVLLNLINNAFYAVNEKAKQKLPGYEPTVSITTKRLNNQVEIKVSDNGDGIPQSIIDKIFQPFFTTKPTGQGTGLGLSLSYDIVKAHGGEINVESKSGEGCTFIVIIPA